jgi:hypothetical protein
MGYYAFIHGSGFVLVIQSPISKANQKCIKGAGMGLRKSPLTVTPALDQAGAC